MFPDDPDEDADNLDDQALLEAYLRPDNARGRGQADEPLPDWPPRRYRDIGIEIDTATLDWFKANHTDWRREIRLVLKGWVAAQTKLKKAPANIEGAALPPSSQLRLPGAGGVDGDRKPDDHAAG